MKHVSKLLLPLLRCPCPGCFGSRGFQLAGPWRWLPHHPARLAHRADLLPCRSATAAPACCPLDCCRDQVLMPGAQTWMKTDKGFRMHLCKRLGFKLGLGLCLPIGAKRRSRGLQRKIGHAKVLDCELPVISLCSIYRNNTTCKRRDPVT